MRATNSTTSSSQKALSSDSMGRAWTTLANFSVGAAPTRRDGLSSRTRAGKRASMAALRCLSASYSASDTMGASS